MKPGELKRLARHLPEGYSLHLLDPSKKTVLQQAISVFDSRFSKGPHAVYALSGGPHTEERFKFVLGDKDGVVFLVKKNNRVVATASGYYAGKADSEGYGKAFFLNYLAVRKRHEGKGVGTALDKIREEYARNRGYDHLMFSTGTDARISMALKNGFREVSRKPVDGTKGWRARLAKKLE